MSLERSVLTEPAIRDLIAHHYSITVSDIHKMPLGSANCYRVSDGTTLYFLKELQSSFTTDVIEREADIVNYLYDNGIPTARFYKTADGLSCFTHNGHVICLQQYIDGQTYGYEDLPEQLLPQVAQMLGKLHAALKNYPLPTDMGAEWLASYSADKLIAQYDDLLCDAEKKPHDLNVPQIIADLNYKKQLARRCEKYIKYFSDITYCPTHGDYQGCQLVFDGSEIKAVIDFSSARSLPAVWEIMRSFVQSSPRCNKTARVDIPSLCDYVREYMKHSPLTAADMQAMPYVYLFQLARSKFGYPQYLNSSSENKEQLLKFAFWRTEMCREMESRGEEIAVALAKLL